MEVKTLNQALYQRGNMKYLIIVLAFLCLESNAFEIKPVESEYLISMGGKIEKFTNGENRQVKINGKNVDVSFSIGDYKTFDNYGVSFKVPQKTSAYIDESSEDFDIWNFDFHDSVMILFVFKNNTFEITDDLLLRQLNKIAGNMNMKVSEPGDFSIKNNKVKGKSAIGTLGEHVMLLEEFGFSSSQHSFMAFYYSPLIERKSRDVGRAYKHFKLTIIESLKY